MNTDLERQIEFLKEGLERIIASKDFGDIDILAKSALAAAFGSDNVVSFSKKKGSELLSEIERCRIDLGLAIAAAIEAGLIVETQNYDPIPPYGDPHVA